MNMIAAVSENNGIGYENALLFHIKEDMKFFREKTIGKTVVMGRKTLESMPNGKPLPKRNNIILSSTLESCDEYIVAKDIPDLLEKIKDKPSEDIFIIGGEKVYREMINYSDTLYITRVFSSPKADAYFPEISPDYWNITYSSEEKISENGLKYKFLTYKNIS